MAQVLLLTGATEPSSRVLPALSLLPHHVRVLPPDAAALIDAPPADVVVVDGRRDLVAARALTRLLSATGTDLPVVLVLTEGGLAALTPEWAMDELLLDSASPAEVDARLRLAIDRAHHGRGSEPDLASPSGLVVDEAAWTARLHGRPLDLTFKEFELLRCLAQHPGRVLTRAQLLHQVWGLDYFGGTRTVDVHVRRLRAKLGAEHEQLIGTVRNVGYRFTAPSDESRLPPHIAVGDLP